MNENQRLLMNKSRAELDTTNCKQQLDEYTIKYNEYCKNIVEMQTIIGWKTLFFENFDKHFNFLDQTEKDMERTTEEIRHKQTLMKHLTKDFDKIFTKKYQLEKKLLENLENQAANDTVKIILSITL